jgi:hypothetical protein
MHCVVRHCTDHCTRQNTTNEFETRYSQNSQDTYQLHRRSCDFSIGTFNVRSIIQANGAEHDRQYVNVPISHAFARDRCHRNRRTYVSREQEESDCHSLHRRSCDFSIGTCNARSIIRANGAEHDKRYVNVPTYISSL